VHNIAKFEKSTMTWTEKTTLTCHWKGYDDGWYITEKATLMWTEKATLTCHWKAYTNVSLKRLWWQVTYYWNCYPDMNWKALWHVTEKVTLTWTEKPTLTYHWKGYNDGWHIIEKAMMTCDISLKRLPWRELKSLFRDVTEKDTLTWIEKPTLTCH
jgi:hypothetical protein